MNKDPIITFTENSFRNKTAEFLIDTGSNLNLIKQGVLIDNISINKNKIFNLIGIGKGITRTLGEVEIEIKGTLIKFQVVPGKFNIQSEGILGIEFLKSQEATLRFKRNSNGDLMIGGMSIPFETHTTIRLSARQKVLVTLPVKNNNLETGYIRKIQAGPGIFLGEVLVNSQNGFVKVFAINSTSEDTELTLPPVELEDFNFVNLEKQSLNKNDPSSEKTPAHAQRLCDIIKLLNIGHLNDEEKTYLLGIINTFPYQFHLPAEKLGNTNVITYEIRTTDEKIVNVKQYRQTQFHKEEALKHVAELLKNDIIKPSNPPYNSPIWIVPKKPDSNGQIKTRMVIDYRSLNEKTISDAYPLPNICDILDQLGGAKYFSTLDLASGFHQIPMDPESQPKTAFSTPYGHYEYKRMPFGLKTAPSTFQRLMDQVLSGLQGLELFVYMDDIVVYSSS